VELDLLWGAQTEKEACLRGRRIGENPNAGVPDGIIENHLDTDFEAPEGGEIKGLKPDDR